MEGKRFSREGKARDTQVRAVSLQNECPGQAQEEGTESTNVRERQLQKFLRNCLFYPRAVLDNCGAVLSLKGYLTILGDIFGCHVDGVLPQSSNRGRGQESAE